MLGSKLVDAIEHKQELRIHGLLDPGSAVLIEGGNAVFGRHEVLTALVSRRFDEVRDCLLCRTIAPGGQGINGCGGRWLTCVGVRRRRICGTTGKYEQREKQCEHGEA